MALRTTLIPVLAVLATLAAAGTGVAAEDGARDAASCERAILTGARRGGVPPEVLHAVALSETGRVLGGRLRPWPWAINREGEGHWFETREEAMAFARASIAAGRTSFDVGCFQINYRWHGHAFASLEAMFDQDTGGTYAAQFLSSLHAELGSWSLAAGAYHSRTPALAERYRDRFDRILAQVGDAPLVVAEADGAQESPPGKPRPSRTRMASRPKVITIGAHAAPADLNADRVAAIRIERGRVPRSVMDQAAGDVAETGPVALSARNAPR